MARFVQHGLVGVALAFAVCCGLVTSVQAQGKTPITSPEEEPGLPEASTQPSLETLVVESGLAYRKMEDGSYRITVESNGVVSVVIAQEFAMGWQDSSGNDVKLVYLYRWLAELPEGAQRPLELLTAINDLNDARYIGRIVANKYGIYVSSSFFLRGATAESLVDEVYLANNDSIKALELLSEMIAELNQSAG